MSNAMENEWLELIRDVNETLKQIEGGGGGALAGSQTWLEGLKDSPVFSKLSAEKLAAVLLKLEEVPVRAGDVVIRQKDPGDSFYVIKSGRFTVSRRKPSGDIELLAQLTEGDSFGEAALLSGEPRNASIVADTDGALLRLARNDFSALIKADLVRQVTLPQAERMIHEGARYLDVRRDTLGQKDVLDGALVIPVDQLRARYAEIDPKTLYIIYCMQGNLSETAAFVLRQRGYNVSVLKGGIAGWH